MTAQEMFEKLDFIQVSILNPITKEEEENIIAYETQDYYEQRYIFFYKEDKTITPFSSDFNYEQRPIKLSVELLKAITKQMEELKWL